MCLNNILERAKKYTLVQKSEFIVVAGRNELKLRSQNQCVIIQTDLFFV